MLGLQTSTRNVSTANASDSQYKSTYNNNYSTLSYSVHSFIPTAGVTNVQAREFQNTDFNPVLQYLGGQGTINLPESFETLRIHGISPAAFPNDPNLTAQANPNNGLGTQFGNLPSQTPQSSSSQFQGVPLASSVPLQSPVASTMANNGSAPSQLASGMQNFMQSIFGAGSQGLSTAVPSQYGSNLSQGYAQQQYPTYADPGQYGYSDPSQGYAQQQYPTYADPGQYGYSDPSQGYAQQQQYPTYADPSQYGSDSSQGYAQQQYPMPGQYGSYPAQGQQQGIAVGEPYPGSGYNDPTSSAQYSGTPSDYIINGQSILPGSLGPSGSIFDTPPQYAQSQFQTPDFFSNVPQVQVPQGQPLPTYRPSPYYGGGY